MRKSNVYGVRLQAGIHSFNLSTCRHLPFPNKLRSSIHIHLLMYYFALFCVLSFGRFVPHKKIYILFKQNKIRRYADGGRYPHAWIILKLDVTHVRTYEPSRTHICILTPPLPRAATWDTSTWAPGRSLLFELLIFIDCIRVHRYSRVAGKNGFELKIHFDWHRLLWI